jgi:hypothetical protein
MKHIYTLLVLTTLFLLAHGASARTSKKQLAPATESDSALMFSVTGSGTTNYIPLWTGSTALGNSKLYQTGGQVGVGTTKPGSALDVSGRVNTSLDYRISGNLELSMPDGSAAGNIAVGDSLANITSGTFNTAIDGAGALALDSSESHNTASGYGVLDFSAPGSFNKVIGNLFQLPPCNQARNNL